MLAWTKGGHAVFVDDFDPDHTTGSLRFQKTSQNAKLHADPPTLIAEQAGTIATIGPDLLLYVIQAGTDDDGAYVRALPN